MVWGMAGEGAGMQGGLHFELANIPYLMGAGIRSYFVPKPAFLYLPISHTGTSAGSNVRILVPSVRLENVVKEDVLLMKVGRGGGAAEGSAGGGGGGRGGTSR